VGTSTYSGTAEGGQQVAAPERAHFTVDRGPMGWSLYLGPIFFNIDQYGHLKSYGGESSAFAPLRARCDAAAVRLREMLFGCRYHRGSALKRAALQAYADQLNEAGL
jgi:hypothetical protein